MRWNTETIIDLIRSHFPDHEVYYAGRVEEDCLVENMKDLETVQVFVENKVAQARVFGHCESSPEDPHDCEVLGILATYMPDTGGYRTYQDLRLIADLGILLEARGYTNPYECGWEVDCKLTHPPHHPRTRWD
jgi:hypothetical protein